jgi:mono/diheme cytochrome c family protein
MRTFSPHRIGPRRSWLALGLPAFVACAIGAGGGPPAPPTAREVDYARQVKPLLTRHCVGCHGAARPRAGLRLDTAAAALKGGKNGPAILPGHGEESPLILALQGEGSGERMPLNRPALSEADIALLRDWIDQGARGMAGERPGVPPAAVHWALIPPRRPVPPEVRTRGWARNPIDRFVLARLEEVGLSPSPEAEPTTLLRRASLDLIGLPPSPAEVAGFLTDPSPDRYERVVDALMASPHFGERWARPWLDQARYADSNGYSIDAPRSIWKYRDWVIAADNADMPFDRFVIDQIAGDLQPAATPAHRIATGFHRNTPINQEGGIDVEQFRIESIVDRVNTTGTVFLGLTVGCAQCHDHKYDPISQRDYYRLFAFFNNVDEPELEIATPSELARRREVRTRIERFHRELAARYPDLDARERRWEEALAPAFKSGAEIEAKLAFDVPRDKRTPAQRRVLAELMILGDPAFEAERPVLKELRAAEPKFITTMVVQERPGPPRETFVHLGGDFTRKGDRVEPGVPAVLPPLDGDSPGHRPDRMDLARWLVDRRNPLTARVVVNRIWQAYFGRGLVETDNDFGTQGSPPSHPELLDWLACELMDRGWSRKAIHRLIVESATYRQASRVRDACQAVDPDNRRLWRQARLRLEAELIRDAALASGGLLTRTVGGPSVFPPQPEGVMDLGQMRRPWRADTGPGRYRRGLYTFFWRATPYAFLTAFDAPGGVQTCTRRLRSDTPLQALTLLNDPAFTEIARGLAARILADRPEPASDGERIDHAFLLCLGRRPSDGERRTLEDFLRTERAREPEAGVPPSPAPPEWIGIARILLNLDEFVTRE